MATRIISDEEFARMMAASHAAAGPHLWMPSGDGVVMVSKLSLGALIHAAREQVAAGDIGKVCHLAALLCKRAAFETDDAEALRFGNEALALLKERASQGDKEAMGMADALLNAVPVLEGV